MAGKFSLSAIFGGKDNLSSIIGRMERNARSKFSAMGASFAKFDERFSGFGEKLGNGLLKGAAVGGAALFGLGGALHSIVGTGAEFEKALIGAASKFDPAITQGTAGFAALRKSAEDIGATTEFNAAQGALALKDLAAAGFSVRQAIAALPGIVNLATAEEMDLAEASNIVTKSLGAFGLASEDAAVQAKNLVRITDAMGMAAGVSKTGMRELFEVSKGAGPIATAAGISMERVLALGAALAEVGIEGSVASTTLENMFTTMSAPTKEAQGVFQKLGIQLRETSGALRDPIAILDDLNKKLGDSPQKVELLEEAFGKIPLAGVAGLLGVGTEKLRNFEGSIVKAAGTIEARAKTMRDSTTSDIDGMSSAWDGLKIAMFGAIAAPVRDSLQGVTKGLGDIQGSVVALTSAAIPFVKEFIGGLAAGFNEAWPAIKGALAVLFDGFGSGATWMTTVKDLAVMLGKITALAVGLAAVLGGMLVAGVQIATKVIGGAVAIITGAWNGMIAGIGASILFWDDTWARIKAFFDNLPEAATNAAKNVANGFVTGLKDGAKWVVEAAANLGQKAIDAIKSKLGIASDSKAFIEVGGFSASGLGSGFEKEMPSVTQRMEHAIKLPTLSSLPTFDPVTLDGAATRGLAERLQLAETIIGPLGMPREAEEPEAQAASRPPRPEAVSTERALLERVFERVDRSETEETSRLIIEDRTGKARFEGKPSKAIKLERSGSFNNDKPKADA